MVLDPPEVEVQKRAGLKPEMQRNLREDLRYGARKILIRGTNWIGDAVMTLPAIASIRRTFPAAEITVLAKPWVAEVYRLSPDIDRIFLFREPGEHQGVLGKLKLASELRREGFAAAIYLQNAIEAAILGRLAGIPLRAGYDSDCRGFLLTHAVHRTKQIKSVYQVDYYLEMVKSLGCKPVSAKVHLDGKRITAKAGETLDIYGISENSVVIGIAPGAMYGPAKMWFPERFGAVGKELEKSFRAKIMIFGSKGDREAAETVQECMGGSAINIAGHTGLDDAIALISRCSLFITNDSGLMHVAGALGIPTLAIYGSTNPVTTPPPGENSVIIRKEVPCSPCLKKVCPTDFRCMAEIRISDVYETARSMLIEHGARQVA